MNPAPDYIHKKFAPMRTKTLKNALAQRLRKDFPRIGGDRILNLCADMIVEVIDRHVRPTETVQHGQVLWMAVSRDDPPAQGKRMTHTDMVPVVLNLSTSEDIEGILARESAENRLLRKALRLCNEAYKQGGDVGTGLTHKDIICRKRYAEGKSQDQIARETHHSLGAVDRYLGKFDRVRHCIQLGMAAPEIAFTLTCSLALVNQYIAIHNALQAETISST